LLGYGHESGGQAEEQMIERENTLFEATWKLFPPF
jgi:hypothetical protein